MDVTAAHCNAMQRRRAIAGRVVVFEATRNCKPRSPEQIAIEVIALVFHAIMLSPLVVGVPQRYWHIE
jgi:hypothetical protein